MHMDEVLNGLSRPALLGGTVLALVLGAALYRALVRSRDVRRCPPVKDGWLPWIGCAVRFGKEPLYFIQRTREELGDLFTVHAAGKWMTFVSDPKDYQHFFHTTKADFQSAVQPFTKGAAGLSSESFYKHHSAIHDTIKGRLIPNYITKLCPILSEGFQKSLSSHGNEGEMELMDFVRDPMFEAVVRQLFGRENVPKSKAEMLEFQRKFVKYDEDFEYGTELPEIFLKDWRESKHWLLSLFKLMVAGIRERGREGGREEKLLVEQLVDAVDPPSAHNYALLLLWASQANAVPAVFWTMAYILSHPEVYATVKRDVDTALPLSSEGRLGAVSEEALKKLASVKRCVLEAIRIHAPGSIVRKVTEEHKIGDHTIPKGHLLMLSPYWCHRHKEKFPNADKFIPDRWLECDLDKNQFLDGFVGFGGGRYQCPGRWFALMEMHLFVAMLLRMFDLEMLDQVPPPSPLHLVGTQQPTKSCRVKYKLRSV